MNGTPEKAGSGEHIAGLPHCNRKNRVRPGVRSPRPAVPSTAPAPRGILPRDSRTGTSAHGA